MLTINTILHPTDFSEASDYAFHFACALARDYNARLILLHVDELSMYVTGEGVFMPPLPPVVDPSLLQEKLIRLKPSDSNIKVEHRIVEGEAAEQILKVAEQSKCDLIILGTHGRTGLTRLLTGSVAEHVLRKANCPVLTVKAPNNPAKAATASTEKKQTTGTA